MMPISNFIGNIGYVGVCIIGGILAGSKTITIGDIQAFIQYVRQSTSQSHRLLRRLTYYKVRVQRQNVSLNS